MEVTVFATSAELQARWRQLSDVEKARAEVLLMDASVLVATMCAQSGVEIDEEDELQALTIKAIVCEMVKRAMLASVDDAPMKQFSQTAGPYTESGTFVNPTGDLYLTSTEQKRLGLKKQRMFSIRPTGGAANEG